MNDVIILTGLMIVIGGCCYMLGFEIAKRRVFKELGDELDNEFRRGLERGREERRKPEDEAFREGLKTGLRMPRPSDAADGFRPPLIRMGATKNDRPIVIVKPEGQTA